MATRKFFINEHDIIDNEAKITGDEHNHLKNVLRLQVGESIILVCGNEFDYYANIEKVDKVATFCTITKKVLNVKNPKLKLTVFQALTKRDAMSNLVMRLGELGASEFVPLETRFITAKDKHGKFEKLQLVANQSVKQSGRSVPLAVLPTIKFTQMLKQLKEFDLVLFANETENKTSLKTIVGTVKKPEKIAMIVGSEGGFSPEEISQIIGAGGKSITLGKRILRVETATIALAALILYELNELN